MKSYSKLKKVSNKNREAEFEAELPEAVLEEGMRYALTEIAADFELPGFRKGRVPPAMVRERVSEADLLQRAADAALRDAIPEIVEDEKLEAVGRPYVTITKIAPKNPVTFKIRFALSPVVTLPDYKKIGRTIAERNDPAEVTEKDLHDAIERILTIARTRAQQGTDSPLPELTDAFVKQLGPFETVTAFKEELTKQLAEEKQFGIKESKRNEIVREIVKQTKLEIAPLLLEQEFDEFAENRDAELLQAKLSFEEYVKQTGKNREEIEKEERAMVLERVKTTLTFREIQIKEDIKAEEKEIVMNAGLLKRRYPKESEEALRRNAEGIVIQEKLFDMLEGIKKQED